MQEREIFFLHRFFGQTAQKLAGLCGAATKKSAKKSADFNYWIRDEEKDEIAVRFFFAPVLFTFATFTTITTITAAASATLAATA